MAGHLTRKELKQDKFAVKVEESVDFFATYRAQIIRYGGILVGIAIIVAAVLYYRSSQHSVREQALGEALTIANAPVGTQVPNGAPSFASDAAKNDAVTRALNKIVSDYSGSEEAYIAEYYLAGRANDAGKMDDARKKYQDVADHANANYASLAKLSLAQIDAAENRTNEAEALLKDLMDHPTDLVSKSQATLVYARVIAPKRPDEARKLLTGLVNPPSDVSQIASVALSEIPQK